MENSRNTEEEQLIIEGRNPVREAFRAGRTIDRLYVQDGLKDGPVLALVSKARKSDAIVTFVSKERLDEMSETGKHQGVIAQCAAYAYAEVEDLLERARENHIPAKCISPKDYESRDVFNEKLLEAVNEYEPDLIVLAGFLVVIPPEMIAAYRNRMINIHPSLIPAFCGKGYYGLKVHEAALARGVKVVGATVHFVDEEPIQGRSSCRKQ